MTAIACAVLGCSLALTLSVWGRKTHEVLMITYLILILWLISPLLLLIVADAFGFSFLTSSVPALWQWIECSNPYYLAFAPYSDPGKVGPTTYLGFLVVCLLVSALLLGLATIRIRGVALKAGRPTSKTGHRGRFVPRCPRVSRWLALPGPSIDGNPVLWREWHRSKPSRWLRVVWLLYTGLGILWIVLSLKAVTATQGNQEIIAIMNMFQVSLGLLLLSVNAANSLAEERLRGSLDALLCTPLSTQSILVGKWLGSFQQAGHVLVWPAVLAGILLMDSGHGISYFMLLGLIAAYCAVITSLGLVLATWISRSGRAVALCVSAYVVFSIGWLVLVALLCNAALVGPALIVGSPLYGTAAATFAVAKGSYFSNNAGEVGFSVFIWILIDGVTSALLFIAALATFDRCLGRISETPGSPPPDRKKKAATDDPDFGEWLGENSAEVPGRG